MASPVIRCSCPNCGGVVGLKDQALFGKRIRCPKCQKPFVVDAPPDEEEPVERPLQTAVKTTSRPSPPRGERDERVQTGPPALKKKPLDEEEDEDDRPRKK